MNIEIFRVGAAAAEVLGTKADGSVLGVTSRGAFLRVEDRIIYLTSANYLSPFNLTLAGGDQRFERLAPGDKFNIEDGRIRFPARQVTVHTATAEVWHPPLPVPFRATTADQRQRSERIAARLNEIDPGKGFLFLSRPLEEFKLADHVRIHQAACEIATAYRAKDLARFMAAAGVLVGTGGGLTPSGDDFLTGFLLYHFRRVLSTGLNDDFLEEWCDEVTRLAFQKTTTISANRLMFTKRGWSEDIFLTLLDHFFDPAVLFDDDLIQLLTEIGHSSGVDTFMGIDYAIRSLG